MTRNKLKRKHRDNSIVSFWLFVITTITLIAVSANENISMVALVLAFISFLGAIFNLLYIWATDEEESKEYERRNKTSHRRWKR